VNTQGKQSPPNRFPRSNQNRISPGKANANQITILGEAGSKRDFVEYLAGSKQVLRLIYDVQQIHLFLLSLSSKEGSYCRSAEFMSNAT